LPFSLFLPSILRVDPVAVQACSIGGVSLGWKGRLAKQGWSWPLFSFSFSSFLRLFGSDAVIGSRAVSLCLFAFGLVFFRCSCAAMYCHLFEFRVAEVRSIPEKEFRVAKEGGCMVLLPFLVGSSVGLLPVG